MHPLSSCQKAKHAKTKRNANSAFAVTLQVFQIAESTTTITRSPFTTIPTGASRTEEAPQKQPQQPCHLTARKGTATLLLHEWLSAKQTDRESSPRLAEVSNRLGGGRQKRAPPRAVSDLLTTGYWEGRPVLFFCRLL